MDKEQAEVIQLLADTAVKLFLAIVAALILVTLTVVLVINPSWPIAAAEGVFVGTVFVVYKHYFPASTGSPPPRPDSQV